MKDGLNLQDVFDGRDEAGADGDARSSGKWPIGLCIAFVGACSALGWIGLFHWAAYAARAG